jgi:hypothetical protein
LWLGPNTSFTSSCKLLKIPATIQTAITDTNCLHCSCVVGEVTLYIRATAIHRSCFREDHIRFHRS